MAKYYKPKQTWWQSLFGIDPKPVKQEPAGKIAGVPYYDSGPSGSTPCSGSGDTGDGGRKGFFDALVDDSTGKPTPWDDFWS